MKYEVMTDRLSIPSTIKWISSGGGPLILMTKQAASEWKGIDTEEPGGISDYDRACEVDGYIDVIDVGVEKALVFGDEPSETTAFPISQSSILFARWIWAESNDEAIEVLRSLSITSLSREDDDNVIDFSASDLILFDSAYSGEEIENFTNITIKPGSFRVRVSEFKPDAKTFFILILLDCKT